MSQAKNLAKMAQSVTAQGVLASTAVQGGGGGASTGTLSTGTTAERPVSPTNGMVRFNTTLGYPEWYSETFSSWFGFSTTGAYSSYLIDYLVVAGGGGGGGRYQSGGGGGGGVLSATAFSVTPGTSTPITITVGAGGTAGAQLTSGGTGGNSVFGTFIAIGGGYGGYNANGGNGGSGGGGSVTTGAVTGGTGVVGPPRQGYAGGNGAPNNVIATSVARAGGGGGAGAVGAAGFDSGNGGIGILSSISGTSTGYAGGGGGASYGIDAGTAVAGYGGGNGGNDTVASVTSGTVNTGGGGGGSERAGPGIGGAGGSGIVIVRYADTYPAAAATTGSPTITVFGGYRIYKFTSSGSITF